MVFFYLDYINANYGKYNVVKSCDCNTSNRVAHYRSAGNNTQNGETYAQSEIKRCFIIENRLLLKTILKGSASNTYNIV